jgi:hypothetical protein
MRKREGADHAGRKMGLELRHVAGAREFAVSNRLRAHRGRLPADFTFDRDEANDR